MVVSALLCNCYVVLSSVLTVMVARARCSDLFLAMFAMIAWVFCMVAKVDADML